MTAIETLGRFGHHPEPATDFCVEVEALEGADFNIKHAIPNAKIGKPEFDRRIERAMSFNVGGDQIAVAAKETLRRIAGIQPVVALR